jgi:uncharacterized protein YecE (DUF72 family)
VFVGVDAPQIGSATAPPHIAITSSKLCIARFHGRNRRTWYVKGQTSGDRFDYLYQPSELDAWVPALRAAGAQGVPVHALFNNNRGNYAVVNAFDMAAMLGPLPPRPPAPIIEAMWRRDGHEPGWVRETQEPPDIVTATPAVEAEEEQRQLRLSL